MISAARPRSRSNARQPGIADRGAVLLLTPLEAKAPETPKEAVKGGKRGMVPSLMKTRPGGRMVARLCPALRTDPKIGLLVLTMPEWLGCFANCSGRRVRDCVLGGGS